ncbi:MATE family efflux transporter, partial [Pseudomonas syringae group genomosp. 7]|uniref:MATE family efflux transporter n=1 Tax=Pseudomonas syringae group genomosp. 7 TaxID=251699 RepID=UPI00376FA500
MPIGVSQLCGVMLFCAAALVLAPLGETQVASHQIAGNVGGLVFMLPLSVGLAASIRVAYHHGR